MKGIVFLILAAPVFAQPAARPSFDAFEVATIKPTPPDWSGGRYMRMQTANQFSARSYEFRILVSAAFNVSPKAISVGAGWGEPGRLDSKWIDSEHFDIVARTPGQVRPTLQEQMAMLRDLLADRFKLAFHRESKDMSYYALTLASGGPKLQESTFDINGTPEGPPPLVFSIAPLLARLPARYATMAEVAWVFQRSALDRPVVDKTGLTGRYDFELQWTPDETQFGGLFNKPPNPDDPVKPGLFAALQQQLGLRLDAAKGPVEALVIDRAERPTEN